MPSLMTGVSDELAGQPVRVGVLSSDLAYMAECRFFTGLTCGVTQFRPLFSPGLLFSLHSTSFLYATECGETTSLCVCRVSCFVGGTWSYSEKSIAVIRALHWCIGALVHWCIGRCSQ